MREPMEDKQDQRQVEASSDLSRRDFIAMAAAAGIVAATDSASAAMPVTETDVTIKTSDGTCDAAFIHPTSDSHPAVIVWSDAFGLRPAMRDIGKRIAAEGYSVLVPNPFYRVKPGPAVDNITSFNFQTDMPKIQPLMASINAPGNCEKDAGEFVAWLDQQKQVNTSKKIGTQGYCMGGPAGVEDLRHPPRSRRRGRLVPRRRTSYRQARQPASARYENQGAHVFRDCIQRRHAPTRRQRQAARDFRGGACAGGDRSLFRRAARLVRARHAAAKRPTDLQ